MFAFIAILSDRFTHKLNSLLLFLEVLYSLGQPGKLFVGRCCPNKKAHQLRNLRLFVISGIDIDFMNSVIQYDIRPINASIDNITGPSQFKQIKFCHINQVDLRQVFVCLSFIQIGDIYVGLIIPHSLLMIVIVGRLQLNVVKPVAGILRQSIQNNGMGTQVPDGILRLNCFDDEIANPCENTERFLTTGFILHDHREKVIVEHGKAPDKLPLFLECSHQCLVCYRIRHLITTLHSFPFYDLLASRIMASTTENIRCCSLEGSFSISSDKTDSLNGEEF